MSRDRAGDPLLRSLTAATVGIVVAFVASSLWSESRLHRLDETARQLAEEIAPRIECLTRLRGELHALEHAGESERSQAEHRLVNQGRVCALSPALVPLVTASSFTAADGELQRLIVDEAHRAARIGPAIVDERIRAERAAVGVHCLAAVVALLGIGMVWLTGRANDLAAQRQAAIDDQERRIAVERARELDLFAARVAHDLKAPLSAVAFYMSAAEGAVMSPQAYTSVKETVAGAIDIVDVLLDYARAGGQPLPADETNVVEVVEHVVTSLDARSRCRVAVEAAADLTAACPRGALRSALANLVRNALEHGIHRGGRAIEVRARRRDGRARIEVTDDGPGVPEPLRARIFEPYVRGDTQSRVGLGLGLATVKRIAEQCGGAAGVERRPVGRGARFWIELPAAHTPSG